MTSPAALLPEHHARPSEPPAERLRGIGVVLCVLALLAGAGLVAVLLAIEGSRAGGQLAASLTIRYDVARLLDTLRDAETGQRGFLLTGDVTYLRPYDAALAAYPAVQEAMNRHAEARPSLAEPVARVGLLAEQKFAELAASLELARQDRRAEALAVVVGGAGLRLMDEIRLTLGTISTHLDQAVQDDAQTRGRVTGALAAAVAALLLGAGVLAVLLLRGTLRHLHVLGRREAGLRSLAVTLESRIEGRTHALNEVNRRFEAALQAANITVFTEAPALDCTWINAGPILGSGGGPETLPANVASAMQRLKEAAAASGEPARAEIRLPRQGSDHWYEISVAALTRADGASDGSVGGLVEVTHRKDQEARIRLLLREVTHRSKNLLAVIQAIMRQTASSSSSTADFVKHFSARLQALAGSHDLLVREDWGHVALADLVRSQLSHYSDVAASQISMSGGDVFVRPDSAQHIGMALHELATNAAKYGALSVPEGHVSITWSVQQDPDTGPICRLAWVESDGPRVAPPASRGFGRVVIERTVARAVDGEATITYAPEGVRWTLVFPPDGLPGHSG